MRVLLVSPENRASCRDHLEEMHRQRKRVFVDWLNWPLPVKGDQEFDRYDHDETYYLIALDEGGVQAGSLRMASTLAPSLIHDAFSHLFADGPPAGPTVWEFNRLCCNRDLSQPSQHLARRVLQLCMMEALYLMGVEEVAGVMTTLLLPGAVSAGWDLTVLGLPHWEGECEVVAFSVRVTPKGIARMRENWGISGPHLVIEPATLPRVA
ncbi:MAG: acyl-homoserine-lactone synthase [Pseudomonadota bacterium]